MNPGFDFLHTDRLNNQGLTSH